MWKTTAICLTLAGLATIAVPATANAKPLGLDECKARLAEHGELVSKGALSLLDKEPEWVKANMTEGDLRRIERLLQVEDDIRFRCSGVEIAGVTPGDLLGKKADDSDEAEGDKDATTETAEATTKASRGPDIPLPLRKPAPPKRTENLRFGSFGQIGRH